MPQPSLDELYQSTTAKPVSQPVADDSSKPSLDDIYHQTTASTNDKTVSPFEKQMTKGLYDTAPFGKRAIKTFTPGAEDEIKNTPEPQTWDEKLGRFVGEAGGMAPAFEAAAGAAGSLLKPVVEGAGNLFKSAVGSGDAALVAKTAQTAQKAKALQGTAELAGGSAGVGANVAGEASSDGKDAGEALKEGAGAAASTMVGGKVLETGAKAINAFAHLPQGARDVSGRIHDMIVRLPIKAFQYAKDPLDVMQKENIVANTTSDYLAQAKERLNMRSAELESAVADNKSTLDISQAVNHRIDSAVEQINDSYKNSDVKEGLIKNLEDLRKNIVNKHEDLNQMSVQDAVKMKRKLADDHPFSPMESTASTGNIMAKVAHQIYHDINTSVDGVSPKIGELNHRVSGLIDITKAAQNRVAVESRNNPLGLIATIVGVGAAGALGGAATGHNPLETGVGAALLMKAGSSPAVLTRVAKALSQMAEVDKINLYKAAPWFMELAQKAHDFVSKGGSKVFNNLGDTDMSDVGKVFGQPGVVKRPTPYVKASQTEWPEVPAKVKPQDQDVVDNMNTYGESKPVNRVAKVTDATAARNGWPQSSESSKTSIFNNRGSAFVGGSPEAEKIINSAKKYYGTTKDIKEAGYLLPDGEMLDFTGRHQATGYENGKPLPGQPDYLKGQRNVDHREIQDVVDAGEDRNGPMHEFVRLGNIRLQPDGIELNQAPTLKQLSVIKQHILNNKGESFFVDIVNRDGTIRKSLTYAYPDIKVSQVINDMKKSLPGKDYDYLGMLGPTAAVGAGAAALVGHNAEAATKADPKEDAGRFKLSAPNYTKEEEGFKEDPYEDTAKHKTIGYGFNMDDSTVKSMLPHEVVSGDRSLTKPEADKVFNKLYTRAQNNAIQFAGNRTWNTLNPKQQQALTDMAYNMGLDKLSGFGQLKAQLQSGNFDRAAKEILNSKYAEKLSDRARRNAAMVSGGWNKSKAS